jgi:hypothetical protein
MNKTLATVVDSLNVFSVIVSKKALLNYGAGNKQVQHFDEHSRRGVAPAKAVGC